MSPADPLPRLLRGIYGLFHATIPSHIRDELQAIGGDDGRVSTTLIHIVSSVYSGTAMAIIMAAMAITMIISTTLKRVFRMILLIFSSSLPLAIFLVLFLGNPVCHSFSENAEDQ